MSNTWLMRIAIDDPEADAVSRIAAIVEGRVPLCWLKAFDANGLGGFGLIVTTTDTSKAKRFPSLEAVLECWKTQSRVRPLRDDGMPNRPLTAYSVEPVEEHVATAEDKPHRPTTTLI